MDINSSKDRKTYKFNIFKTTSYILGLSHDFSMLVQRHTIDLDKKSKTSN